MEAEHLGGLMFWPVKGQHRPVLHAEAGLHAPLDLLQMTGEQLFFAHM